MRAVMAEADYDAAPAHKGEVIAFPALGSKENPFPRRDSEALREVLVDFVIDCQFNVRTRRIEWAGMGPFDDDECWKPITDRKLAELRERIERKYWRQSDRGVQPLKWGRDAFQDTLNALVYHRERDPFMDWLDALPPWDGFARLEGALLQSPAGW